MQYNLQDYRKKAHSFYEALTKTSTQQGVCNDGGSALESCNYWRVGCVLDTLIDYLLYAVKSGDVPLTEAQQVLRTAYDRYLWLLKGPNGKTGNSSNGSWYDDFGWWGIAAAKAYDPSYAVLFGDHLQLYKNIAITCWTTMHHGKFDDYHHGAPNVFDKCDQTVFGSVKPKFEGGVWQYDIFADHRDVETSPSNPSTPIQVNGYAPVELGPYQLTVVNGLYFILGMRLYLAQVINNSAAENLFRFMHNWTFDKTLTADQRIINTFGKPLGEPSTYGLIRERVSIYSNGNSVNYYNKEAAWGGDQGLMLGGLIDYFQKFHLPDSYYMAQVLVQGVKNQMTEKLKNNRIVLKSCYPGITTPPFLNDQGDYSSGLGVYMRNLLYAYKRNTGIRNILMGDPIYRGLLFSTADSCVDGTLPTYNNPLFDNFNYLASLLMACSLLTPGEEIAEW